MSFREKSAWISLVSHGLVFGAYFLTLWRAWDERGGHGFGLLVAAVLALIVIAVALTIVAAIFSRDANSAADERERLFELKAERTASFALSAGVVCLIGALLVGWDAFLVANLLLAALVVAELIKALVQIAHFRGVFA